MIFYTFAGDQTVRDWTALATSCARTRRWNR